MQMKVNVGHALGGMIVMVWDGATNGKARPKAALAQHARYQSNVAPQNQSNAAPQNQSNAAPQNQSNEAPQSKSNAAPQNQSNAAPLN